MRIIDMLAFIAYPLIVVNLALLLLYLSSSFIFQFKNRVLMVFMFFVYMVAIAWGLQQFSNIYNRYQIVFGGVEPVVNSLPFIILQVVIAIGLTGINYLLYTNRTNMTLPLPGYKKRNGNRDKEELD